MSVALMIQCLGFGIALLFFVPMLVSSVKELINTCNDAKRDNDRFVCQVTGEAWEQAHKLQESK